MGGRIERIIRATVSWPNRSPADLSVNRGLRLAFAPYENPVCSRRQRHGLGGSGNPRSPSRQLHTSGLQLRRLESRVWSLYCCFARIRRTVVVGRASNQPGGVATLSRHFFIAPFSVPAKQKHCQQSWHWCDDKCWYWAILNLFTVSLSACYCARPASMTRPTWG